MFSHFYFHRIGLFFFFFFFSSRRRHTRSLRDWSSDVCSSDLKLPPGSPGTTRTSPMPRIDARSTSVVRSEEADRSIGPAGDDGVGGMFAPPWHRPAQRGANVAVTS